ECIISLGYGNGSECSTLREWLCSDVVCQCIVGNSFNETIADRTRHDAEGFHSFRCGDVFDDIGIRSAGVNQLPAGCVNKCAVRNVTGSEFHLLSESTNVNELVTRSTSGVVVGWSKTIFDSLVFGEDEFVIFKPAVPARGGC